SAPARCAEAAQLEQVLLDAEAGRPAHLGEGALQRAGVELARDAASRAYHRVVAARLPPRAGTHGRGTEHAVQEPQLEQGGDVPVDGHAVHRRSAAAQLALQLARAEGTRMILDQLEQRAAAAGHAAALPAEGSLRARGEAHPG